MGLIKSSIGRKILFFLVVLFIVVSIVVSLLFSYGFRNYSVKLAEKEAISLANSIKDGLTSKMGDGTMDTRYEFLKKVFSHQKVKDYHLYRTKIVTSQFGSGTKDDEKLKFLEKEVLKDKKIKTKIYEDFLSANIIVSIPYIANSNDKPNCLRCHNAKNGDILGIISLDIDISDIKIESLKIIGYILLFVFIFFIIALLISQKILIPYIKLFESIEKVISRIFKGDYEGSIDTKLQDEGGKIAQILNRLIEIHRFKKTIELDEDKYAVYSRIAKVLENRFGIKKYILFEIDKKVKSREIIFYTIEKQDLDKNADLCRAYRTSKDVFSGEFDDICLNCKQDSKYYICLDFEVDENFTIVLHLYFDSEQEYNRAKGNIQYLSNYIEISKAVIESKILLAKLKDTSVKDPLTGLYNRRFLNDLLESNIPSRVKDGFVHALIMCDIDLFKQVNDTYGHDVGDQVIKQLAFIIKKYIRNSDVAVRYGGEEFIILLVNSNKEATLDKANKISNDFKNIVFRGNGETFQKTISMGISYYPTDATKLWQAIKFADEALYYSKEHGRDKITEFDKTMHKNGEEY